MKWQSRHMRLAHFLSQLAADSHFPFGNQRKKLIKTTSRSAVGIALTTILFCLGTSGWSAETPEKKQPVHEDFACDTADGVNNKIIRVCTVTPASVFAVYDGEHNGCKIPHRVSPPQLKARYAYSKIPIGWSTACGSGRGRMIADRSFTFLAWNQMTTDRKHTSHSNLQTDTI
jgi:hypothetical protein